MESQVVTSVQGGLPPPGGRTLTRGTPLEESPELQALFQSLMASLMGSMMIDPAAAPTPAEAQGDAASVEMNAGIILTTPTTQDGALTWITQNKSILAQGGDPLGAAQAGKDAAAVTADFASLLPSAKAGMDQAQSATILAESAETVPQPTVSTAQPAAVGAAMAKSADQSALQMATTAQAASAQSDDGADEQLRPQFEVSTAPTAATTSGIGSLTTNNTVEVANATSRSAQPTPIQQIAERVQVTLDEGENSATIRLQPEELGGVRIRLQVQGGQLHLSIQAEKTQTGRLLDQQLGDLRQSLESGGIKVGDLAVLAGSRTHVAGSESMGREAGQMIKTFSMEMGGNSTQQQNHHQQQAAFAGHNGQPERDHLPYYGQPTKGQNGIGIPGMEKVNASNPWIWQSAPQGVDYYA